jgi:hypothetical protein
MSKNQNEFRIVGKVVTTPIKESGNTNGKDWHKLNFQVQTEIEYSEKYTETNMINVSLFGKVIDKVSNVQVGQIVELKGSINSKEFNGKWYTNLKVFSAEIVGEKERNKKDDADDIYQDLDSQNLPF